MTEEIEIAEERHFFRNLVRLAMFAGLIYVVARFLSQKKNEYSGLTESEARAKFVDKVGPKLGDDTAEEIADQVIPKLKERGILRPDPAEAEADAGDESDAVTDAVDSVVKD